MAYEYFENALRSLTEGCRSGRPYSSVQVFKALLLRGAHSPDRSEAFLHGMLNHALVEAVLPFRCAEAASELAPCLIGLFTAFMRTPDEFSMTCVRNVSDWLVSGELESTAWWLAHERFLREAYSWWSSFEEKNAENEFFFHESLANTYLRQIRCIGTSPSESPTPEAMQKRLNETLVKAYKESLFCPENRELIGCVVSRIKMGLGGEWRSLIARTVHGVLAGGANEGPVRRQAVLREASKLLAEATSSSPALVAFLKDVIAILGAKKRSDGATVAGGASRPHTLAVAALCKEYESTLQPVSDLDWPKLSKSF